MNPLKGFNQLVWFVFEEIGSYIDLLEQQLCLIHISISLKDCCNIFTEIRMSSKIICVNELRKNKSEFIKALS